MKGDTVAAQNGDCMVLAWRDKRVVKVISTMHNDEIVNVHVWQHGQREHVAMQKPKCVVDYNKSMNAVDLMDQMLAYYPFIKKTEVA